MTTKLPPYKLTEANVHGSVAWLTHFLNCSERPELVAYASSFLAISMGLERGIRHKEIDMETISYPQAIARPSLDRVIESTVVLSWDELMPDVTPGIIHVEYHTGPERLLQYLKVWSSTEKGNWNLICEYWKCSLWAHVPGFVLGNRHQSGVFYGRLDSLMQNEVIFGKLPHQDGLIQIHPPTNGERQAAADSMIGLLGES